MKFQAAAMSRADIPNKEDRVPFALYVDEFQNFATDSFASILSEARKFKLSLIVANQYIDQLKEEIKDAVFGNVGTVVVFRVGTDDAEYIAKQLSPVFDADDLQRMPNWNCAVKLLIKGFPTQPFSMATLPPFGEPNKKLIEALKQLSAAKYARPRSVVGVEISERLFTKTQPQDQAPGNMGLDTMSKPLGSGPKPLPTKSSFLDEWLAKRKIREQSTGSTKTPTMPKNSATGQDNAPQGQSQPVVTDKTNTDVLNNTQDTTGISPESDGKDINQAHDNLLNTDEHTVHLN
jgi:hypothetical protein